MLRTTPGGSNRKTQHNEGPERRTWAAVSHSHISPANDYRIQTRKSAPECLSDVNCEQEVILLPYARWTYLPTG